MTRTRNALAPYLASATLARGASESAGPALLVVTIAVVGSASIGSFVVAAMTATAAVFGPLVGAVLDRAHRTRRAFASAIAVLAFGLAGVAIAVGHVPIFMLLLLAAIAGLGYPAVTGAWSAQLPKLVDKTRLTRAYSADAATYSVAAVVAPPLAAALVAVNDRAPLVLSVSLAVCALIGVRFVRLPDKAATSARVSLLSDIRAGTTVMVRNVALRRTVVITTIGFAGQAPLFVAAPLLAQSVAGSLQFTGLILGAFAAGGVVTALWFTRRPVVRPDRMIIASTLASAVALAAIGFAPNSPLLLIAAFVMGALEPPLLSSMFQVRARESPPRVQAQIFTTSASLRTAAFAAGTAICGGLLVWGTEALIVFGVLLHVVAVIVGVIVGPHLPRREHWVRSR